MTTLSDYAPNATIFESRSTLVQRATRSPDGQSVVLKTPFGSGRVANVAGKYREEFELLRIYDNPLVIKAYELILNGEDPTLVLEYFDGSSSLRNIIRDYAWPSPLLIPLWIQLADALEAIHAKKIIHKDVNPNNVLVHSHTQAIKIIDFGCASRFGSAEQAFQSPSSLEGTLPYISPEQTGRANRSLDERSDFYSLGVTFYELASGNLPFRAIDALDLVYSHLARKPPPLVEVVPDFPAPLSQIVSKLLEKSPERRYQSAAGLSSDLKVAWEEWQPHGRISSFVLGQHDRGRHFHIVEKLYGREREVDTLARVLATACDGRPRLLLVDGPSGTGKTSIVQETYKQLTPRKGNFIRGKFDQFKRDVPFSALVQSFQEFIRQSLSEPEDVLLALKSRLHSAVGVNAAVLIEVIPEMRWLFDNVVPVPDLTPAEMQNRFNNVFGSFLKTCSGREHPLVLFLDDLQWADNATLDLLRLLLIHTEDDIALLVVGAYRTHEVDEAHPLMALTQALERANAPIDRITVPSLNVGHIEELLGDTLAWKPSECTEFATILWDRTRGNPFFLHQFLTLIHQKGGLAFDSNQQRWTWDIDLVREQVVTGDVVDLLLERLRRLSQDAQLALGVAACMGARFRLHALAIALEKTIEEANGALNESFQEGLVVLAGSVGRRNGSEPYDQGETVRFAHDRVQQAAYLLVDNDKRSSTHLQIGRRMLEAASHDALDNQLFDIVEHYAAAITILDEPVERLRICELFYQAGIKAQRATAYHPGVRYLKSALALLPDNPWRNHYPLTMGIYRELNQCAYLASDNEYSEQMGAIVLRNAKSDLERAPVWITQMFREVAAQKLTSATRTGLHALSRFGVHVSENPTPFTVLMNIVILHLAYADATVEDIVTAPVMTDPKALACMHFSFAMLASAYLSNKPNLFAVCSMIPLRLSIRHGHTSITRSSFVAYAIVLCALGRYRRAQKYADLSFKLFERYPDAYQECMMHFAIGSHINHWSGPARLGLPFLERACQLGIESGNYLYVGWSYINGVFLHQFLGSSVSTILEENRKAQAFVSRSSDATLRAGTRAIEITYALSTATDHATIQALTDELKEGVFGPDNESLSIFALQSMVAHALFGSSHDLQWLTTLAERTYERFFITSVGRVVHHFFHSLLLADAFPTSTFFGKLKCLRYLWRNERRMAGWARDCPENYQHHLSMIRAELAVIRGRFERALKLYDAAIRSADAHDYPHVRALANERAAKLCYERGLPKLANAYVIDAHKAYGRWGATRKVRELERAHPDLLTSIPALPLPSILSREHHSITSTAPVSQLDVTTIVRASQALAGERDLDDLLRRLMKMVLENAGAQRGVLVLNQKDGLHIAATFDADQVTVGLNYPLEGHPLAQNVVQYVARTQEPIVLDDATADTRFRSDPHLAQGEVLSLLCLALTHQRRLAGILYLEHYEMRRAFSPERLAFLDVIASQAAIAVENALLYSEIRATNQSLEAQVEERTRSLERTLSDLWGEMDLAKKIQTVLLPLDETFDGYAIASMMKPADQVGGDYYDIIPAAGKTWVLIGDVSGHGISAGLIMMMVQTSIRTVLSDAPDISPSKLLSRVNRSVIRNLKTIGRNDYMTIQAFCFEDSGQVTYAGLHQEVLVYRSAERRVEVCSELNGMWIGMMDDIDHAMVDNTLQLGVGDIVLMYTDGMTEARQEGALLEVSGLAKLFEREAARGFTGPALITALASILTDVTVDDDVSLMAVQRIATN